MTLLAATAGAIVLLLFLILVWKLHAGLALLVTSVALGLASGMAPQAVLGSVQKGIAELLGSVAVIVAAGAILGRMIEVSGGGEAVARALIRVFGAARIPWALLAAAYLVGIPVFFDAAFLALIPLVRSLAREAKRSLLLYALPMTAALTATHGLVPPHPGPAAAAELLGADLGRTILYGLVLAIPMAIAGGMVWGGWIGRRMFIGVSERIGPAEATPRRKVGFPEVTGVVLFPVALIALSAWMPRMPWARFFGTPWLAMTAAAVASLLALGLRSGATGEALLRHTSEALNSIGSLVVIIGAAGGFKQVIVDTGAGSQFAQWMAGARVPPLLLGFLVGAALRVTLGSATAAMVTAAGIVAPMAASFQSTDPVLMVMAVTTGGSVLSHVNDAGFWMVKEYCGMTVQETLKSYSVMKAVTSLTGLAALWALSLKRVS